MGPEHNSHASGRIREAAYDCYNAVVFPRRLGLLLVTLAGCGPAVETPPSGTSGTPSSSTTVGGSSGPFATVGTSESSGSSAATTTSSSSGEAPALTEFEGLFRYDAAAYENPLSFQTCDGAWADTGLVRSDAVTFSRCVTARG